MSFSHHSRLFLSQWITALLPAVPIRSRATFIELLCACLVSPEGWVTRAISAIVRRCHWNTYYKLIERGSIRSVPLARALLSLVQSVLPLQTLNLVIDDTLALRLTPYAIRQRRPAVPFVMITPTKPIGPISCKPSAGSPWASAS